MEKLLVEFARNADRERFDLRFVALAARGGPADEIEACGWPVTALEAPPGLRPSLVFRLARLLRGWGTDVVHTHNSKPLIYAGPAARLAGVRRVIHTRHGQRFNADRAATALFRLATRTADRLVCVSYDSARLSRLEGLRADKVVVVWNGIDVSRFGFLGPHAGGPAVMVGRLSAEKDVETLVRAAAAVTRVDPSFRLEIAGDGPCRPPLEALARNLLPDGQVRFLGEVRDVPGLLAGASLFVLPSLTEGISLTLLEAMARGLPVIATRVGGNPEVVDHRRTGVLVPARSPDELAAAVLSLFHDPEECRRMGREGRRRVEQHFDVRRMVADYERLYIDPNALPPDRSGAVWEEPAATFLDSARPESDVTALPAVVRE
jgi:glycosyltransferase involved in cell wall biosynthesis